MKKLLKWGIRLLICLVILLVAAMLLFDTVVTSLAESRIRTATGLEVKIGKLEIGLLHPKCSLENFKLYNTAEFGGAPMLDLPELHLEYDREALNQGRLHFKLIRFNLAELNLVKNQVGRTNILELFTKLQTANLRKTKAMKLEFSGVDTLTFTLGKLIQTDLGQSNSPRAFDFRVKNQTITDLKTEEDVRTKLLPIIVRAGIALLTDGLFKPAQPPGQSTGLNRERAGGLVPVPVSP